jgi:glutaredoxin
MIFVELFSKENCHLCKEALGVLRKVQREIPYSLLERKIVSEDPSHVHFKDRIPVVFINHKEAFHFRVDERALRKRLLTLTS